jgi:DNA polymerase-3 subunit delta'
MWGHTWAVDLLRQHIAADRLRHAYLITGPTGVGRRTLARHLAQALNCTQPPAPGEFCGVCRACRGFANLAHPDLTVVQAERVGGALKVDQIRELTRSLALSPYEANYRVALLLRFEEAQASAANALLKTLEEPPGRVILILTAESAEALLPTITSRCETIRLRPLPLAEVQAKLEATGLAPERAALLAHLTGGRPGAALRLHADGDALEKRSQWLDDLTQLLPAARVERFAYAETLTKERDREKSTLREQCLVWLAYWRDVLLTAAGAAAAIGNLDRQAEIEALAAQVGVTGAQDALRAVEQTLLRLDRNANARLAVEVLMLDLPRLSPTNF